MSHLSLCIWGFFQNSWEILKLFFPLTFLVFLILFYLSLQDFNLDFIFLLVFFWGGGYSFYKYYCLCSCIITPFNRHFTRLWKIALFSVFGYSCDHVWLQWKSLFWDIMLFSASTYSFFENAAKVHVMTQFGFIIYDLLFLLDKLDLTDKI